MNTNQTDTFYINAILEGDTNAYATLIDKYKNMVYSLSLKMLIQKEEAEEAAQDSFIKAYTNLSKFEGKSKFSTWLYKITYRNCLDRIKKNRNQHKLIDINEITVNFIKDAETVLDSIEKEERKKLLKECLNKLDEEERTILWLYYFDEMSLKEIVSITSLSLSNVKVKLHRARKSLLKVVKNNVESEIISHYGKR